MTFYQYPHIHIKVICRRFCIITLTNFWNILTHIYGMFVYKHTKIIDILKISLFYRKMLTLQINNEQSRIIRVLLYEP